MQVKPLLIFFDANHTNAIQCIVMVINDVTSKSCEQRLITKGHIVTRTNLILLFKPALYSMIKVVQSCFKPKFLL